MSISSSPYFCFVDGLGGFGSLTHRFCLKVRCLTHPRGSVVPGPNEGRPNSSVPGGAKASPEVHAALLRQQQRQDAGGTQLPGERGAGPLAEHLLPPDAFDERPKGVCPPSSRRGSERSREKSSMGHTAKAFVLRHAVFPPSGARKETRQQLPTHGTQPLTSSGVFLQRSYGVVAFGASRPCSSTKAMCCSS